MSFSKVSSRGRCRRQRGAPRLKVNLVAGGEPPLCHSVTSPPARGERVPRRSLVEDLQINIFFVKLRPIDPLGDRAGSRSDDDVFG